MKTALILALGFQFFSIALCIIAGDGLAAMAVGISAGPVAGALAERC